MPWDDWQFYVVTALALAGLWMIVRTFLPRRRGSAKGKSRVKLTVNRRRV